MNSIKYNIYISVPQLTISIAYLLSHLIQPSVYCGGLVCAGQGRASLQGGLEWPLHDQPGSHSGSHGAFVSQSNLAVSYLPSIHLSHCFLLARVPAAASLSHVTIEPGLDGCCSESRESPIWTTGETEERQGEDREVDSNQMHFSGGQRLVRSDLLSLPQLSFFFHFFSQMNVFPFFKKKTKTIDDFVMTSYFICILKQKKSFQWWQFDTFVHRVVHNFQFKGIAHYMGIFCYPNWAQWLLDLSKTWRNTGLDNKVFRPTLYLAGWM